MRVRNILVAMALLIGLSGLGGLHFSVRAEDDPITDYYSPCKGGTAGNVSTWHGKNRDGRPPYDPNRRTYDFRCVDTEIYAVYSGKVYGVTPRFGGVILIQDDVHGVCMVYLGMNSQAVEPNQWVETGTYLGTYRLFHFTAVRGNCADANWYDVAARERERPVAFREFGEVIAPDIRRPKVVEFVSLNPAQGKDAPPNKDELLIALEGQDCGDWLEGGNWMSR